MPPASTDRAGGFCTPCSLPDVQRGSVGSSALFCSYLFCTRQTDLVWDPTQSIAEWGLTFTCSGRQSVLHSPAASCPKGNFLTQSTSDRLPYALSAKRIGPKILPHSGSYSPRRRGRLCLIVYTIIILCVFGSILGYLLVSTLDCKVLEDPDQYCFFF